MTLDHVERRTPNDKLAASAVFILVRPKWAEKKDCLVSAKILECIVGFKLHQHRPQIAHHGGMMMMLTAS